MINRREARTVGTSIIRLFYLLIYTFLLRYNIKGLEKYIFYIYQGMYRNVWVNLSVFNKGVRVALCEWPNNAVPCCDIAWVIVGAQHWQWPIEDIDCNHNLSPSKTLYFEKSTEIVCIRLGKLLNGWFLSRDVLQFVYNITNCRTKS